MSDKPKHGRRAQGEEDEQPKAVMKGWGEDSLQPDATMGSMKADGTDALEVPNLDDGVDATQQDVREEEDMSKEVANAPTDYHSQMPKLHDLNSSKWGHITGKSDDIDISCLTAVLCNQLDDEDAAWNPDLLLVQLTSELLDAAEQKADDAEAPVASPTTGGLRERKEVSADKKA